MTSEDLKALVKEYFNLVEAATPETTEETFGELKDINGAFTVKFPGDSLQVGDKVTIVTTEGQEMDAPDGTHELEDGTKIVTKDSVVEEIMSADGEKEMSEEAMAEIEVEVGEEEVEMEDMPSMEEVVKAIAEAVEEKMAKMEERMAAMESKMESFDAAPAAEKTLPSNSKFAAVTPNKSLNRFTMEEMIAKIKTKK